MFRLLRPFYRSLERATTLHAQTLASSSRKVEQKREEALGGGGEQRIAKQHEKVSDKRRDNRTRFPLLYCGPCTVLGSPDGARETSPPSRPRLVSRVRHVRDARLRRFRHGKSKGKPRKRDPSARQVRLYSF